MAKTRRPRITERLNALAVGAGLPMKGLNAASVRATAAVISRNTGRQFTIDDGPTGAVITRRG